MKAEAKRAKRIKRKQGGDVDETQLTPGLEPEGSSVESETPDEST